MAAWGRERFERGGLRGGKLERKLKKSEVNHLDVLAVRHPSVSPADKAGPRFPLVEFSQWTSRASVVKTLSFQPLCLLLFISSQQLLELVSILSALSCHLSFFNALRLAALSTSRVS